MKFFVDTSAWVALFNVDDKYHQAAASAMQQLSGKPAIFFTSEYVFDEAVTLLQIRVNHQQAVQFGKWLLASENVTNIRIDKSLWQAAWEMFQTYTDKSWAFTDCTSFVLMRQLNLHRAFAFDQHFVQAGFKLWPGSEIEYSNESWDNSRTEKV